jgi:hypothetical protein
MTFFNSGLAKVMRKLHLDSQYIYRVSELPRLFPVLCPLMGDLRFPIDVVKGLGIVGLTLMSWLSVMDAAFELEQHNFFDACLRYEEMTTDTIPFLRFLFFRLALDVKFISDDVVNAVMQQDDHAIRSRMSAILHGGKPRDNYEYIRSSDLDAITLILSRHQQLSELKFILPSTFSITKS